MRPEDIDEVRALKFMAAFDEFDNLCHDMSVNARATHRDKFDMIRRLETMWLLVNPASLDLDDEPAVPDAANATMPAAERQAFRRTVDAWLKHMDEMLVEIDELQFNHTKVWALNALWEHVKKMLEMVGSDLLSVPDLTNPHVPLEEVSQPFGRVPIVVENRLLWDAGYCPGCNDSKVVNGESMCPSCLIRFAPPRAVDPSSGVDDDPSAALVRRWIGACSECDPKRYYSLLLSISAGRPELWCRSCRSPVFLERMRGEYSLSYLCSQRCRWAIGSECRCSCGGVNHGRRYSLN